ncbi:site-specific integrase [Aeoliella sp. ICT_H6.2]|uniref:Site-specific integrase n=1 Tax=Aeoliella straminimaris TaxID=2954799 RepID=A0A9X2JF38_9BACT|nr:phage integrase SAM-like domain-containing protein [Aeoliella straminimaris]MCO6043301.1 site-specific integrase [Aeoliella straminimaris]
MASLAKGPNGRHRILVNVGDRRETVSLNSKIRRSEAKKILHHIEELATAVNYGTQRAPQTSRWLAELAPKFHAKLAAKGLCEPVELPGTVAPKSLGAMINTIKANEWATLAGSTVAIYERASDNLQDYFGSDRKPESITLGDAQAFVTWLRAHENLAQATANKRAAIASKFFRSAIRYKWLEDNPFDGVKKTNVATTRFRFVETADAEAVLQELPTLEWKLLFALSRWGGLRVASEPRQLKWGHVDWEQNRLLVPCPKTANAGRAVRVVPIFPELYLRQLDSVSFACESPLVSAVANALQLCLAMPAP